MTYNFSSYEFALFVMFYSTRLKFYLLFESLVANYTSLERRRRIHTEAKAKVVASDWEIEFIQLLAALFIVH